LETQGELILGATLQERFSFLAFGPYGPVYIQFGQNSLNSDIDLNDFTHGIDLPKLSANGWPVKRVAKGRYRVMEPDGCVEVTSDDPDAP